MGVSMYGRRLKNVLLRKMSPDDFRFFENHMERIELPFWLGLEARGQPIDSVYFIETGIAAIIADMRGGCDTEVGLIGFEGMTGTATVSGSNYALHKCLMQIPGEGFRVPIAALMSAASQSPQLRQLLLRYMQTLYVQATASAVSNVRSRLEERLARLLLRCHDRVATDAIPITHKVLAIMLGVRRPRVTHGLHLLENEGLIRLNRGEIIIHHRDRLIVRANGSYGACVAEYNRLIGMTTKSHRKTLCHV